MDENQMQDLMDLLSETGLPFAYDHFAEGESPEPPFITFLIPASDNFSADGVVYLKVDVVHIELYTDEKNPETEAEVWIESERLYEVLYSFERKVPENG